MIQIILKSLLCKKAVEVDNPENLKVENVVPLVLFVKKDLRKKMYIKPPSLQEGNPLDLQEITLLALFSPCGSNQTSLTDK